MKISTNITINASRAQVWDVISDIDNAAERISGIEKIEVLERPEQGLVGLKWKETRIMFGKTADETMWITDAKENEYYMTRAENHGAVYESGLRLEGEDGNVTLTMEFEGTPSSAIAKVMSFIMTPLFKGATVKALKKDLEDIKAYVESKN